MPVAYDPVERTVSEQGEGSRLSRSGGLLLELTVRDQPSGSTRLDRLDWRAILTLADLCIESSLRAEGAHYGLEPIRTKVSRSFELSWERLPGPLDFEAYQRHHVEENQNRDGPPDAPPDSASESDYARAVPGFTDLDTGLREAYGFGLATFVQVLTMLQTWPVTASEPLALVSVDDAVGFCAPVVSGSGEEIRAVVEFLTLTADELRNQPMEPWELQRRHGRVVTHPLIQTPAGLAILPWTIGEASTVYKGYLSGGSFPRPVADWPQALARNLERYRDRRNRRLEDDVVGVLDSLEGRARARIRPEDCGQIGLRQLTGEIDALYLSPRKEEIWVIEVKDPLPVFGVSAIERHVRRFLEEPDGYVAKTLRKADDVRRDPSAVARALGYSQDREWRVQALMVTREHVMAAFHVRATIPFTTLARLKEIVS